MPKFRAGRDAITGLSDMPPIEELSPDDVEAIVAFVREQQRIQGFDPYLP